MQAYKSHVSSNGHFGASMKVGKSQFGRVRYIRLSFQTVMADLISSGAPVRAAALVPTGYQNIHVS